MKKFIIVAGIIIVLISAAIFLSRPQVNNTPVLQTATPSPSVMEEKITITASFKIMTGDITRSFANPKYHNQSEDVFLSTNDSTIVHVTKSGITWADFFNTLPMKLTKDCLTTGDGEKLCDGQGGSLNFYLNGNEDIDLLDKEIKDNDQALITYK